MSAEMQATPGAAVHGGSTLQVRVSAGMVKQFAALTGDQSSLHVSDTFARRSAYRQPVVHGMLPIAYLALLPSLHVEGFRAVPVALTGRFTSPVFQGDALTLTGTAARTAANGTDREVDYEIARDRTVVTAGTITVSFVPAQARRASAAPGSSGALLLEPVELNNFQLEDIAAGATDCLRFAVTDGAIRALVSLLAEGADEDGRVRASQAPERIHLPNLLGMLLYSTSIGVSLPGASATFLEFTARVERSLEEAVEYALRGRIAHRSASTRILKKELVVAAAETEEVAIRGKASTLVAKPFIRMPTIDELKELGADFGLRGRVVLVTGASRGIGETTAKLFAIHGARVVVNYHRGADDAKRVVAEIAGAGGEAVAIAADVSKPEDVRVLVARARERFGAVHVLVNNAARDYRPVPFLKLSWEEVQKDLDVILKGAFLCCQEVIPLMLEQGEGRIINVSTIATDNPPPDQTKYVVAKSALVGLTRSLSIELAARNIQVNLVVPNFVETDFVAHVQDGFRKKIAKEIPMQRAASPVDVARAVVFLASSYSSFTTGQKLLVTGGGAPYL
jgi:3-oxoacyl-[acyl-carrier protein] reductase